jgi:hypothetical protein
MRGWWTLGRASGVGAGAGSFALLLWPFWARGGEAMLWFFAAFAAVAGLCGVSILLITGIDMVVRRRGRRIRPVRGFDIVLGLALVMLSVAQLKDAAGQLPA